MSSFNKLNKDYAYLGIEFRMRDIVQITQITNELVDEINRGASTRIGELCVKLVALSSELHSEFDLISILARPLYQKPIMQSPRNTPSHSDSQSSPLGLVHYNFERFQYAGRFQYFK